MASDSERLDALRKFVGDIIVYPDKSISMYSTVDRQPDSYGKDWDEALDRLHKRQAARKTDD